MVNLMLFNSGFSEGYWGEGIFMVFYILSRVFDKRSFIVYMNFGIKYI